MIMDRLDEFGVTFVGGEAVGDLEQVLQSVEKTLGALIPADYREVLLHFQRAFTFDCDLRFRLLQPPPWLPEDGTLDLAFFYGLNPGDYSLRHVVNVYRGRVPVSLVPIAGDGGDNLICLGVRGNVLGKVFFWYHEGEKPLTGNPENDFSNLYLAADSLRSFVEGLVRRNDSLDAEGLNDVELTLDDDLR